MQPIFSDKDILDAALYNRTVTKDVAVRDETVKIRLRITHKDHKRGQASLQVLKYGASPQPSPYLWCGFADINTTAEAMTQINWATLRR